MQISYKYTIWLLLPLLFITCQQNSKQADQEASSQKQQDTIDYNWKKTVTYQIDMEEARLEGKDTLAAFRPLIENWIKAAKDGELTVYDPVDKSTKMTPKEVKEIGHNVDTQWITNPNTGEEEKKVIEKSLNLSNIKRLLVKEKWYYSKADHRLKRKTIAIAPMRAAYDRNGNFVADIPMFWMYKKEKYIPDSD